MTARTALLFGLLALLIALTGVWLGLNTMLTIVNMGLISAIMALGVNLQWGYAGLFNIGVLGFAALGGLAAVLIAMPTTTEAVAAGGGSILVALLVGLAVIVALVQVWTRMRPGAARLGVAAVVAVGGFMAYRALFDPAVAAVEAVSPASTGYLGGLGLPILLAWPVGGLLAAGAAWVIGKTALGLRSDYLAIATLGIAEIILAVIKNEDWLARGVKNVQGIPSPVPDAIDLQADPDFVARAAEWGMDPVLASTVTNKLGYTALFATVLLILFVLAELARRSPWGRMMRAIRDNEVSAEAMGKDVTARHLQVFVLGSAIIGIAGAMMVTQDGQLTPGSYNPLRYTFLIWVMVIVGGSGNNWGSVLGGMFIWWLYVVVEQIGRTVVGGITEPLVAMGLDARTVSGWADHSRLLTLGVILLLVLRFAPRGLLPER